VAREHLLPLVLAVALTAGCSSGGGGGDEMIDWDLSDSHTTADVDWPKPGQSAVQVEPVDSVRIRLPAGRAFEASDGVRAVGLERKGDEVTTVQLDSEPQSTDDAYQLALRWAKEWDLPRRPLDDWYRDRRAGRERGQEDLTSTALATAGPDERIGESGPVPSIRILHSFMDDRPSLVSLRFFW
jgi:hypothetical protein